MMMMPVPTNQLPPLTEEEQLLQRLAAGETRAFWKLFQPYRDYLLRCCLQWTNGNLTAAEDLLSQATLKAWEKAQEYAEKIENFKSWLISLTRNFWIDLTRRPRRRGITSVEDIELYGQQDELGLVAVDQTPDSALEEVDKKMVVRAAIDELPTWLRETFILHYYQELSNQQIAERQEISDANVRQRISRARKILARELRGYFIGDVVKETDPVKVASKPTKSKKARKKVAKVETIAPPETEPSNSGVNTEYSNSELEEETESQGDTADPEAIESNRAPAETSDLIQGASIASASIASASIEGASIVGASIAPLPLPYCHSREGGNPLSPAPTASTGRKHCAPTNTLRNRVSAKNLTGETEILIETRFLDPHILSKPHPSLSKPHPMSFPRRRESTFPGTNTSTNTGIDSS
jgi:RNA polymerase sigma factor (sigma-70 family)